MVVEKVLKGESIVGTMLRVCKNPIVTHLVKNAQLDFFMMDMELGSYSLELLSDIFMSGRSQGLGVFVRVPELTKGYVSRALDLGANGVMVPMIESVEQAKALVEWSKYTPIGNRGMTPMGGHTNYQKETKITEMMSRLNSQTLSIAQIETGKGVELSEAIAAVEGIDVLLIGPNDLSVSLGCPGELDSPQMQEAIKKVAQACQNNNKVLGMHGTVPLLEKWIPYGIKFIMSSTDLDIIANGLKTLNENCRKLI